MWTEEPGCRFFCSGGLGDGVCGLWSLVCVAVVGMGRGVDCWWSVVMAAVAGVEDNGFYFYISPAKTEEK